MEIRTLKIPEDIAAFKMIRRQVVKDTPEAFGESLKETLQKNDKDYEYHLADHGRGDFVVGAFEGDILIGIAGFYREHRENLSHKGNIWGVYVDPNRRKQGTAEALLIQLIQQVKELSGITHIKLTVSSTSKAALGLYTKMGFNVYGTEPDALVVAGKSYDEHLMQLKLTF